MICKHCGGMFSRYSSGARDGGFCSVHCLRDNDQLLREKIDSAVKCWECGRPLHSVNPKSIKEYQYLFCSVTCSDIWITKQKLDYTEGGEL